MDYKIEFQQSTHKDYKMVYYTHDNKPYSPQGELTDEDVKIIEGEHSPAFGIYQIYREAGLGVHEAFINTCCHKLQQPVSFPVDFKSVK